MAHGESGMDGPVLPAPHTRADRRDAVTFLHEEILGSKEKITLVTLAPLTNIATLFTRYPAVLEKIEKLMTNDSLSQAEKFMGFFASINLTQLTGDEEIVDYFNQPQNALFHEKSNRLLIKKLSPVLAQIISEGMESGLFDTPFPAETAELILVGITGFVDSKDSPVEENQTNRRMESFLYNAARMLGMSQSGLDGFKKLFLSK